MKKEKNKNFLFQDKDKLITHFIYLAKQQELTEQRRKEIKKRLFDRIETEERDSLKKEMKKLNKTFTSIYRQLQSTRLKLEIIESKACT